MPAQVHVCLDRTPDETWLGERRVDVAEARGSQAVQVFGKRFALEAISVDRRHVGICQHGSRIADRRAQHLQWGHPLVVDVE